MKIQEFINYNHICPICEEPLGMYMQWIDSLLFRAKQIEPNVFVFKPILSTGSQDPFDKYKEDYFIMDLTSGKLQTDFTPEIRSLAKKYNMFLFFLCNPAGIKVKSWGDYEIEPYRGCYYRSSPFLEMKGHDRNYEIDLMQPDDKPVINKDECFCVKTKNKDLEKVYMVNLEYLEEKTTLWYYSVTDEQKETMGFKPKLFEKDLPLLKNTPNFSFTDRSRLIERLDNWILMS